MCEFALRAPIAIAVLEMIAKGLVLAVVGVSTTRNLMNFGRVARAVAPVLVPGLRCSAAAGTSGRSPLEGWIKVVGWPRRSVTPESSRRAQQSCLDHQGRHFEFLAPEFFVGDEPFEDGVPGPRGVVFGYSPVRLGC